MGLAGPSRLRVSRMPALQHQEKPKSTARNHPAKSRDGAAVPMPKEKE